MIEVMRQVGVIRKSDLFDSDWYLQRYQDVASLGIDPIEHYVRFGTLLGRSPHPLFDAPWYSAYHTDVARSGKEALMHFIHFGRHEGRKTRPVDGVYPTYALCLDRRGGLDHKHDHWDSVREDKFLQALDVVHASAPAQLPGAAIIMPTYNRAAELGAAILSVQAQDHPTWELIVVDDGSTDDTEAVLAPFLADPRIRYIRQEQAGVAKARNSGLAAATAPYVFYLDSDNTWREDFLCTMLAFMTATGLDAASCGAVCNDDGKRATHYRGDDFCWAECLRENYVDMNGFGHRRELVAGFGNFDESLLRLVDWDFILRLTRDTLTAYAPFCGVHYYDGNKGSRISNTHYLGGMLQAVAMRIRRKHPQRQMPRAPRLIAETLLAGATPMPVSGPQERQVYDRRIGYVVWDWPALSQTFVLNEIRTLLARGADVIVYYKTIADTPSTLDFNVAAHRVDDAAHLARLVQEHGRSVLHSPFAYPATSLLTWPCAMETGIPFTFMPGGVDISHYENMRRNRVGEVASSPQCKGVITLGSYHRDFLVEQGVPADKIVLERQAVQLPAFSPREQATARPRVITIARFIEKKGLAHLVDAAAALPEADFHLYGYGPLESALRSQVQEMGLANVTFLDPLTNTNALHAAYARGGFFALPCIRASNGDLDGLPTVILEAMGSGVPVISTRISNIPDVISDGLTGFLATPGDTASLVDKLREAFAMSAEQRQSMLLAARTLVEAYAGDARAVTTLERVWSS